MLRLRGQRRYCQRHRVRPAPERGVAGVLTGTATRAEFEQSGSRLLGAIAVVEQAALLTLRRDAGAVAGTGLRSLADMDPETCRAIIEMIASAA